MRILFFTWRYTLRRFSSVVTALANDGHEILVAYPHGRKAKLPGRLRGCPGVTLETYHEVADPERGPALLLLRQTRDYAWYLRPEHAVATFNRRRALRHLVATATQGTHSSDSGWPDPAIPLDAASARSLEASLAALDARLPPDEGIVALLAERDPDLVMVSPLVRPKTHQTEIVKAARSLGIPCAGLIYSWDSLSNKGRIHTAPDRLFVWNEVQRREAQELHDIDPGTVAVTGAPHWDTFFARQPSVTREQLYTEHGFDADAPLVLYLGSTNEVCPDERAVVERWLEALRGFDGPLARANVLVRGHPKEFDRWKDWRPAQERVSVSLKADRTVQSLFDELHHAAAAVGLNTSAQIEASILGKPVYTFSAGAAAPAQSGSRHFYYLLRDNGGVVTYAKTIEEHLQQLDRGVAGEYDRDAIRSFAEEFVRPRGIDREVVPIVVDELLALARGRERAVVA